MKIGDLVQKVKGYGSDQNWLGVIVDFIENTSKPRVIVYTEDGIDKWLIWSVEVVNESR